MEIHRVEIIFDVVKGERQTSVGFIVIPESPSRKVTEGRPFVPIGKKK